MTIPYPGTEESIDFKKRSTSLDNINYLLLMLIIDGFFTNVYWVKSKCCLVDAICFKPLYNLNIMLYSRYISVCTRTFL